MHYNSRARESRRAGTRRAGRGAETAPRGMPATGVAGRAGNTDGARERATWHAGAPCAGAPRSRRNTTMVDGTSMRQTENAPFHFIGVGGVGMSGIARVGGRPGTCGHGFGHQGEPLHQAAERRRRAGVHWARARKRAGGRSGGGGVHGHSAEQSRTGGRAGARAAHLAPRQDAGALGRGAGHLGGGRHPRQDHHVLHAGKRAGRARAGSHVPHRRHRARLCHERPFGRRGAGTWWRPTRATSRSRTFLPQPCW